MALDPKKLEELKRFAVVLERAMADAGMKRADAPERRCSARGREGL